MRKAIVKVVCLLLLIPILGFGLPFGSAYVYGKIRYAEKRSKAVSVLDAHESELLAIIEGKPADVAGIGFERLIQTENNFFFQLTYDGKLGSWVPCGLLYGNDLNAVEPWQKIAPIRGDWYFYWET